MSDVPQDAIDALDNGDVMPAARWMADQMSERVDVEWEKAVIFTAAAQIAEKRGDYHGDMYGCVQCYHARTPGDRCPEGQLVRAVRRLQSLPDVIS